MLEGRTCPRHAAFEERRLEVRIVGDAAGRFDAQLIKRAVSNLLSNAARHATSGTVVEVDVRNVGGDRCTLCVRNRGPTIAATHLPRLFDRFYRADPARGDSSRHHGLGLAIVAAIARMHDGSPYARSDESATEIGIEIGCVGPLARAPARRVRRAAAPEPSLGGGSG